MAEIGILNGLAQNMGYDDKINDLRYQEREKQRALADVSAQQALFAQDVDYQNAANSHDAPIIKEFAKTKINEIGKFVRENPDWQYNVDKRLMLNQMKKDLKDNGELKRGLASDNSYKAYLGDLQEVAKNPNAHDTEAYDNISQQWNNYLQYGNQGGLEAAQKEGKKAFIYQKPQDFVDLPQTLLKAGNSVKDYEVKKGKNIGEYWTEPKLDQVNAIKNSIYQQHGRQIMVEAKKLGLKTQAEIDKWVGDNISAGFNKHYSIGDANAAFSNAMRVKEFNEKTGKIKPISQTYTPFDNLVDPHNVAGTIPVDLARKIWSDKPNIQVLGNNGVKADLTGLDMNYDGRFVKKNGIPMLLGYVKVPLATAKQKGIISGDDDDIEAGNFSDNGARVTSDYLGKAAFEKSGDVDKDGKQKAYVKVSYQIPVNPNDVTARQMYNVQADVDKLVPASQNPFQNTQTQPKTVVQNGYTYTWDENSQSYK